MLIGAEWRCGECIGRDGGERVVPPAHLRTGRMDSAAYWSIHARRVSDVPMLSRRKILHRLHQVRVNHPA